MAVSLLADARLMLALLCVGAFGLLLAGHVLLCRFWLARRPDQSPQKLTAAWGLLVNLPLLATWAALEPRLGLAQWSAGAAYLLLFHNAVAYAYFHLFNLSETGRRVRMLVAIDAGQDPSDVGMRDYSPELMVEQRLVRLVQMGQIEQRDGRWFLRSRLLLRIGRLVQAFGLLATGRRAESLSGLAE